MSPVAIAAGQLPSAPMLSKKMLFLMNSMFAGDLGHRVRVADLDGAVRPLRDDVVVVRAAGAAAEQRAEARRAGVVLLPDRRHVVDGAAACAASAVYDGAVAWLSDS